jgi:hypothetical protein
MQPLLYEEVEGRFRPPFARAPQSMFLPHRSWLDGLPPLLEISGYNFTKRMRIIELVIHETNALRQLWLAKNAGIKIEGCGNYHEGFETERSWPKQLQFLAALEMAEAHHPHKLSCEG